MLTHLRPAIVMIVLFTLLTGLAYPLAITGLAQLALPGPANGSLLTRNGVVVGSALIGQPFATDRYFHGRPSATSAADPNDSTKTIDAPYNAANSAGSNLGPTSRKLVDRVGAAVAALGGSVEHPVPADAVTTSASGLDPDISPAYARMQVARVAMSRHRSADTIQALVDTGTSGLFGDAHVNVLALNMAVDALDPAPAAPRPPEPVKGASRGNGAPVQ